MTEPSLQLGNGNWAGKSGNLLAYHKANNNFYADELTFTRASTGTRVNADGLIEEVPYNLLQQSNQFDTTWINQLSGTIVGGQSGYDGTDNAWKLSKSAATFKSVRQVITTSGIQTLSAYLKADTLDKASLRIDATNVIFVDFDLTNGTYSISGGYPTSANIQEVSNGWYRADVTFNESITNVHIYVDKSNATSGSIFVQDAQLNKGATAKPYFPTTTRLNFPRVDYLNNANGSLLLEPQRTNLNTYSEDIPQNYVATEISDTFGYSTSPNGLQTSTRLQLSNLGSSRYVHTLTGIVSSGTSYNFSCYYKGTQGETAYMYALPVGGTAITKAITFTGEWQRENLTFTAGSASNYVYIVDSRQGGDASDFEVWGVQVEAGSYATSYIPTSGATVTRVADSASKTGISSLINDSEGVLYFEGSVLDISTSNSWISISEDANYNNNQFNLRFVADSNLIQAVSRAGGLGQDVVLKYTLTDKTALNKIAIKYKVNDWALWVNGVEVDTETSSNAFTANSLDVLDFNRGNDSNYFYGKCQNLQIFKTALTDTELATLTTL